MEPSLESNSNVTAKKWRKKIETPNRKKNWKRSEWIWFLEWCVWCDEVWLIRNIKSGSISTGSGLQISGGRVVVMGEFGVRQSKEWGWVESKVGVAGFGLKGEWLSLGQTLSWSGIDSPIEKA